MKFNLIFNSPENIYNVFGKPNNQTSKLILNKQNLVKWLIEQQNFSVILYMYSIFLIF
jgi:hypothetical protein